MEIFFAITDRLCIFDGKSISKGPTITSEEINNKDFKKSFISFEDRYDIFQKEIIRKELKLFLCDFLFKAKEGFI